MIDHTTSSSVHSPSPPDHDVSHPLRHQITVWPSPLSVTRSQMQDARARELVRYNQEVRRQCIEVTEYKNYGGPLTLLNTFIAVGTGLEEYQHLP